MRVNIREARAWEHSPQGSSQHVLICAALLVGISFSLERLTIFVYRHPLSACASVSRSRVRQPAWQAWRTCCLSTHISNRSSGLRFPQFLYIYRYALCWESCGKLRLTGSLSGDYCSYSTKGVSPCSQSPNSQNSSDARPCYTMLPQQPPDKSPACGVASPSHEFAAHSPYFKPSGKKLCPNKFNFEGNYWGIPGKYNLFLLRSRIKLIREAIWSSFSFEKLISTSLENDKTSQFISEKKFCQHKKYITALFCS